MTQTVHCGQDLKTKNAKHILARWLILVGQLWAYLWAYSRTLSYGGALGSWSAFQRCCLMQVTRSASSAYGKTKKWQNQLLY